MSSKIAQKRAKQRRRDLMKQKSRIYNQVEPRILRPSAKKRLKLERSRRQWIFPWMINPDYRLGQTYPAASLLGLPTELRQRIFHEAFDMKELSTRARAICPTQVPIKSIRKSQEAKLLETKDPNKGLEVHQAKYTMAIRLRVGEFSCVSALIRRDMEYVKRIWLRDLEGYFRLKDVRSKYEASLDAWLDKVNHRSLNVKGKEVTVIKAKDQRASVIRPQKCWKCTERHVRYDA
ncbi:hypothetical protein A1F94_001825 [Pyrenophora tritici-repentis]|nr:hypothetical protein PtrV1_02421 [Pyrenophora tritici-repentis]KAF7455177.1 hypothetical protein A1F99_024350 [Pyrenophora tritici-repentis]KAF7578340.1 hypothetical protein PtrM4_025800 [Pyrenophora tritici-repentis]KAG9388932.1 hypothetical protein A1F94_001825 [Pyrenophora tritici-repentis]